MRGRGMPCPLSYGRSPFQTAQYTIQPRPTIGGNPSTIPATSEEQQPRCDKIAYFLPPRVYGTLLNCQDEQVRQHLPPIGNLHRQRLESPGGTIEAYSGSIFQTSLRDARFFWGKPAQRWDRWVHVKCPSGADRNARYSDFCGTTRAPALGQRRLCSLQRVAILAFSFN
jgi:hypothetical protein